MPGKDQAVTTDENLSVEFIPVPFGNQPQPQTINMILQSLGGAYTQPKNGDEPHKLEGWVPPSNRFGETAATDPVLGRHKAAVMNLVDSQGELGAVINAVDPRDNDNAPDTREDVKKVASTPK